MQPDGKPASTLQSFPSSYSNVLSDDILSPKADVPLTHNRRKPLLSGIQTVTSIRELIPFFSNISIQAYEGVYASIGGPNVDWEAVESGLLLEIFDGGR